MKPEHVNSNMGNKFSYHEVENKSNIVASSFLKKCRNFLGPIGPKNNLHSSKSATEITTIKNNRNIQESTDAYFKSDKLSHDHKNKWVIKNLLNRDTSKQKYEFNLLIPETKLLILDSLLKQKQLEGNVDEIALYKNLVDDMDTFQATDILLSALNRLQFIPAEDLFAEEKDIIRSARSFFHNLSSNVQEQVRDNIYSNDNSEIYINMLGILSEAEHRDNLELQRKHGFE